MEQRDQRQKSHGVPVCGKCGWHFPNPHPSAKRRRAHKRVCGTIEGFKLVESEANTLVNISDDDGDHKTSSPKVLGRSYSDKGLDGMKTKSKTSEDEMFSDALAEFSVGVGPNKSMGDALDSVSLSKMVMEDEMSSSQTLKDREVLADNRKVENSVIAESSINQSGSDQENKINQEFLNLEMDSGTPLPSSSTENRINGSLVVAETAIDQSGNEQETKINQELVDLETDFGAPSSSSSTENLKVENSVVAETAIKQSGTEQETKINQEYGNLKTNFRTGNSVIPPIDHMNTTTTTGDLYPNEPETMIPALQQEWNIDSVENMPQCFWPSPDRRYDEKKNEDFELCKNLTETAASFGKIDNDKSEPLLETEETIEIPTEPFTYNGTLQSVADNDMSIHSEMPQSVVSVVKLIDLTQVTSDARKELESCSSNNLLETNKIKERNDKVHVPSVSSDLNIVDRPEALVEDSKDHDHKEVKLTNRIVHDPHEGVSGLEDNFKDSNPKESYFTLQAEPFDLTSEIASFDTKTVENRQKQESGVKNVSVDVKADCSSKSGQEAEEIPIQEVNAAQIKGILGENEEHDKNQTLSDVANFGIDSIPSASFAPEVKSVVPSKNSLDDLSENITDVLLSEVGRGGVLLADDENNAGPCRRNSEDTVQVRLPVDALERKDNGVSEKDKFDNLDTAGAEDKKDPSEEKFSIWIDSTPESTSNSKENKCIAGAEEMSDESRRKISPTESTDSRKFDISLASDTQESVKEDDHSTSVHVECISEVNSDDQSCHIRDFNSVRKSSDVQANKEANLVSVSNESVTGRSDAFQDGSVIQLVGDGARIASETWKDDGVKIDVEPQLTSALLDASVDVISQTDSLEGNWGSVSVLSTLSDLPAVVDGKVTRQARAEAEETDLKKADAATERQHSNKSDLFEPPSFMTLVEPNGGGIQNREPPNSASLQPGWFPSYTYVANDSPGKKKNEAIIAKVTNWSAGKPHTALKNLLDDAALENKQKSPTRIANMASMIHKDEKPTKSGSVEKTVNSVTRPKSPTSQLVSREIANEWNSPARYPSDIRRERRKGRSYWAQFVCCSSVH